MKIRWKTAGWKYRIEEAEGIGEPALEDLGGAEDPLLISHGQFRRHQNTKAEEEA